MDGPTEGRPFTVLIVPELVGGLNHHFDLKVEVAPEIEPSEVVEPTPEEPTDEYDECSGCYGYEDEEAWV